MAGRNVCIQSRRRRRIGAHPASARPAGAFRLPLGLGLAAFVAVGLALAAEPPPEKRLKQIENALEKGRAKQEAAEREAETLGAEIAKLRVESVAAARTAQEHEAAITALEEQLDSLAADETAKVADLQRREEQQTQLLMALQRLARHPPEALALGPQEPVDAVRSAMLLGAALPHLAAQAKELEAALAALARLREEMAGKKQELVRRHDALAREQKRMGDLIARKGALQSRIAQRVEIGAQRLQQLSQQASDLRELIERLEAERKRREEEERQRLAEERQRQTELLARAMARPPRPEEVPEEAAPESETETAAQAPAAPRSVAAVSPKPRPDPARPKNLRSFAAARGALAMPVSGRIIRRYGEAEGVGMTSKGLTIQTRPGAQVVAPYDGRIEFAGPFRGYGQILIIEHGDGYHSLLAGLERIDGAVGQWLVAGEPVGAMTSGEAKPSLYLELRRHGQPINPLPWLATRDEKVSG